MKRILALLIFLVICFSVCACNNTAPTDAGTSESTESTVTDAPETTEAPKTDAETEFVPGEDNVIWAENDDAFHDAVSTMMPPFFGYPLQYIKDGEPHVDDNVKELFDKAEGKRIAVSIEYAVKSDTADSGWIIDTALLDIPDEYIFGERFFFLTVDEIEALAEKAEGDTNVRLVISAVFKDDYDSAALGK